MVEQLTILTPPDARVAYLALPEGTRAELINDCIYMSPAPYWNHQYALKQLYFAIESHLLAHNDKGMLLFAPVDVHLNDSNIFQPDLVYVARERRSLLTRKGIMGAPDLVVEVLSPSNAYYDLTEKKRVYELAGVPYYWIVDVERKAVEGHKLSDAVYHTEFRVVGQGLFAPQLFPGLEIPVADLFDAEAFTI